MGVVLGITDFWTYVLGTLAIVLLPGLNSIFVLAVGAQRGVRAGYQAAAGVFIGDAVLMALAAAGVASLLRTYPPVFMVIKYAGAAYLAWVGLGIIRGAWRKWRDRGNATAARQVADAVTTDRAGPNAADTAMTHSASPNAADTAMTDGAGPNAADTAMTHSAGPDAPDTVMTDGRRRRGRRRRAGLDQARPTGLSAGMQRPFRRALVVSLLNPKAILFVVSFFIQFVEPGYAYPALSFLVLGAVLQVFSALYLTALIFGGQFLAGQFRRRRRLSAGVATGIGAVFVGFGIKLATATTG